MLGLPKLARLCLAEFVEPAGADHRFQFLARWRNAPEEISQRREWPSFASINHSFRSAGSQPLDASQWCADELALRHKGRSRLIDGRRQEFQTETMTLQDIDQRMIKAFAVGQDSRYEFGGVPEYTFLVLLVSIKAAVNRPKNARIKYSVQFVNCCRNVTEFSATADFSSSGIFRNTT